MKINLFDMRERIALDGVEKYGTLWMNIARVTALASTAKRRQVGCVIVTPSMGLYTGYNGTIAGGSNECEKDGETKVEVYHAEENALDKMLNEGVSAKGSVIFLTLSPCIHCAKRIRGAGVRKVYYLEEYKCTYGIRHLNDNGVKCLKFPYELKENLDSHEEEDYIYRVGRK